MPRKLPSWRNIAISEYDKFAQIQLIVADLDGTLVYHGKDDIYLKLANYIMSLRRHGVFFTVATGRTLTGAIKFLNSLHIDKAIPVILYNGSLVIEHVNGVIKRNTTISSKSLRTIIKLSMLFETYVLAYYVYGPPLPLFNRTYETIHGWSNYFQPKRDFNGIEIEWSSSIDNILHESPTAILVKTNGDMTVTEYLLNRFSDIQDISITKSGVSDNIEIKPVNSDKGIALNYVSEMTGIAKKYILAIGDNDNDAEMIAYAGIGVAVGAASRKALSVSDYYCEYEATEGTIQLLKTVKEAIRYFTSKDKKSDI
ncbi:MAG: HAD family hydrolase [Thermodesulfobacteriota bacterium]